MNFPDDLKYTEEHEWVKVQGKTALVGITDYAQEQLGDIVYVELPDDGEIVSKGDAMGVVESVKSVSDVNAPISGKVVETNNPLNDDPAIINGDPYGDGWFAKLELTDLTEVNDLMNAKEYEAFVSEEKA